MKTKVWNLKKLKLTRTGKPLLTGVSITDLNEIETEQHPKHIAPPLHTVPQMSPHQAKLDKKPLTTQNHQLVENFLSKRVF